MGDTILQALAGVGRIRPPDDPRPLWRSLAERLAEPGGAEIVSGPGEGGLQLFTSLAEVPDAELRERALAAAAGAVVFCLDAKGEGWLAATHPHLLYGFAVQLTGRLGDRPLAEVAGGAVFEAAFAWQRSTYDFFLSQEGRVQRGLDREAYLRRLAEQGFTHVEVNALAAPMGLESGPPGEIYPMFYTYCPALDQFVDTPLNEGLYPRDWLEANRARLKENAGLAVNYGLVPGLLCFEPRSVPESFFERWPMLRGARVDHPFRSFKPRYNMTITHPRVREHYAGMVRRLMAEVPELGFLSVWSNDSGAGFEHTKSLYVGRNGGAYLIREWKDDAEIARLAGENALRFLYLLRDAGREVNPQWRVMTRLESFYGEHETVWAGLGEGVDVETNSLVARGWAMPYSHPRYPDSHEINGGTIHQLAFDPAERAKGAELVERGAHAHYYAAFGPHAFLAPLLGVPYPRLTLQRLRLLHQGGVTHLARTGGTAPPGLVPFDPNGEAAAAFQFDPDLDIEATVRGLALARAGEAFAGALLEAWRQAEEALLAFPNLTALYTTIGFAWYRLWTRPLVPDIERIPEAERRYYQDVMCTTPHNPNNVDLSRDVLFRLVTPEGAERFRERFDAHVRVPLDAAVDALGEVRAAAEEALGPGNVVGDQWVRLRALRSWLVTMHSVAAWIVGVYGWMAAAEAGEEAGKTAARALLEAMIAEEIANTRELLTLLESGVAFLASGDGEETPLLYAWDRLPDQLRRRIELMERHRGDEPRIDHGYLERRSGAPVESGSAGQPLREA
jgi:hypothetical protein